MKKWISFWFSIILCLLFSGVTFSQGISTPDPSGHSILYQEGVNVTVTKDGKTIKERIAIYGVAGLSFPVQRLEVDRRARLSKTVIEIEDANDGLLIPKKDSGVPINMGFGQNKEFGASFFTHAINVTWQFVKSGIRFVSEDGLYEVEKVGATISFTLDGVKLDGIKIASKK